MFVLLFVLQVAILVTADEERNRTRRGVVFRDDFNGNTFNRNNYIQEMTMSGNGNHEFEVYTPDEKNTFVRDGYLHIKPTFTVDSSRFGSDLYSGRYILNNLYQDKGWKCTNGGNWGCDKSIFDYTDIMNPIMSGRLRTKAAIQYGRVTVRAKIPQGAWLWPAIWLLPRDWSYGGWPKSGEIDIMESIGNVRAMSGGTNKGVNQVSSTLHWGPDSGHNRYYKTHSEKRKYSGDYHDFHDYKLEWTADHIQTFVDNEMILNVPTPGNSFWGFGGFSGNDIWQSGGKNAPFDKPFQVILNLAVGGDFFADNWQYDVPKPWTHGDSKSMRHFWERRGEWQHTWQGDNSDFIIDYIEMMQY